MQPRAHTPLNIYTIFPFPVCQSTLPWPSEHEEYKYRAQRVTHGQRFWGTVDASIEVERKVFAELSLWIKESAGRGSPHMSE